MERPLISLKQLRFFKGSFDFPLKIQCSGYFQFTYNLKSLAELGHATKMSMKIITIMLTTSTACANSACSKVQNMPQSLTELTPKTFTTDRILLLLRAPSISCLLCI